jgi:hypothetical protein
MNPRRFKGSLRVFAVDPSTHGFGYAVFEGPARLVDWSAIDIRKDKERATLAKLEALLRRFEPDLLVVENCAHRSSRRGQRIALLAHAMLATARRLGVKGHALPVAHVYRHFAKSGARNKHEIAAALATRFPGLLLRLPPKRKPWQSEDSRMSIFDAAAFGVTYYLRERSKTRRMRDS